MGWFMKDRCKDENGKQKSRCDCKYGDFITKTVSMDKNRNLKFEFTSWEPELVQLLVDKGMIERLPEEDEQVRITILKC